MKHASAVTATGWLHEPRADAGLHFLREDDTWRYLTYEDLAGRVAAMAEVLRDQGLAGRRLGMVGETSEDFIVQYFATLATGGTGDVLAGILGAILARGLEPWLAAAAAVYVHGLAGDVAARRLGQESLLAGDLIEALPDAIRSLGQADS